MKQNFLNQEKGRSMVEVIATIALIGLLSFIAFSGIQSAKILLKTAQILNDVHLAYEDVHSIPNRDNQLYPLSFTPSSGLNTLTQRFQTQHNENVDFIIVHDISPRICEKLLSKQKEENIFIFKPVDANTNYIYFNNCQEASDNIMAFTFQEDISKTECAGGCPEHAQCNLSLGCLCDAGYEKNDENLCVPITCPIVQEIIDIQKEYCCQQSLGIWHQELCSCPKGQFFNGQFCESPSNFCVYSYQNPQGGSFLSDCSYTYQQASGGGHQSDCSYTYQQALGGGYQSDCSYSIQEQSHNNDHTTYAMTEKTACPKGQYCVLNWADKSCGTFAPADTTGIIYGTCSDFSTTFSECKQPDANQTPHIEVRQDCKNENEYCAIMWSDKTCQAPLAPHASGVMYGSCIPFTENSAICPIHEMNQL